MSTYLAVNDDLVINKINFASKRIVYIAPGISEKVADALGKRLPEVGQLEVTVVLDPDDDVCRIGYGDGEGLKLLHDLASKNLIGLRSQPGLRISVLLIDDEVLVWSPSPTSIEAPPESDAHPNGIFLGNANNPSKLLADAVSAEGTDTDIQMAEIGKAAITPEQVTETLVALKMNPPVPVDLARVTRVFNTKLQFIEIEVKNASISRREVKISNHHFNADAEGDLKTLLDTKIKALADLRNEEMATPDYGDDGKQSFNSDSTPKTRMHSEASLERVRHDLEKRFVSNLPGYGKIIERDRAELFKKLLEAYESQVITHAQKMREKVASEAIKSVEHIMQLIKKRADKPIPNEDALRTELHESIAKIESSDPKVKLVFKDITYQQTQDAKFTTLLEKALPPHVFKKLGGKKWLNEFVAVQERTAP